jgi:hypothetical protein
MAYIDYDASQAQPKADFALLPNGIYRAVATESDVKIAKTSGKAYYAYKFQIMEGVHKGRLLYQNFYVNSTNEIALAINKSNWEALVFATVGPCIVQDTNDLLSKPLLIKVGVGKKEEASGDVKNEIKNFYPDSLEFDAYAEPEVKQASPAKMAPAPRHLVGPAVGAALADVAGAAPLGRQEHKLNRYPQGFDGFPLLI